jgi:sterol desaturase/sphingolipid hydroxylase (fatty acid hydroxylase superfamily)
LNDEGLMDKNFGIGFFFFDRIFLTFQRESKSFNDRAYAAAAHRYGFMAENSVTGGQGLPES